jgi:Bardet-Biedl syndrome 7 protein
MELSLSRVDLLQVGSTARNNLRLLPLQKRSTQKVVVGDNDGVINCFGMKKGKADSSFKAGPLTKEITSLSLGGVSGSTSWSAQCSTLRSSLRASSPSLP